MVVANLTTLQLHIVTDFYPQTWTFSIQIPALKKLLCLKNLCKNLILYLPAGFPSIKPGFVSRPV
jgi:hypothetical protein